MGAVPVAFMNSGAFDLTKVEAVSRGFVENLGKNVRGLYDWAVTNVDGKKMEGASEATYRAYHALTNSQEQIVSGSPEEVYVGLALKEAFFTAAISNDSATVDVLAEHFPKATGFSVEDIGEIEKLGFVNIAKIARQAVALER
ncbi:MAG: hypothetical protein AUJ12_01590 [Alphaproteobacteria bacterium CG1_02_46_17]|nr:MAG: hypothetical protein AUJ12_01590 [Alphaproteobacteria bacterium CG1_02_46_17]